MRLGIFGGTFDPPHCGHLRLAEAARVQLQLDHVLWVLTADPPHKHNLPISPVADRLAMVAAALAAEHAGEVSRVDIDRPGPHLAVDTVALLAQHYPGAQLVYLMGGDSLRDLPHWIRPEAFLAHCSLGVLRRPGDAIDLPTLERALPPLAGKVAFVQSSLVNISSKEIRHRVQAGAPLEGWVPPVVAQIIRERGLYVAGGQPVRTTEGENQK
jgi:nicotinate-nucleotide adenylyltransferase